MKKGLKSVFADKRAEMTNKIIGIIVALFIAGSMLPTAIVQVSNETAYSGADANVITIATVVLPLLAIVGIALMLFRKR